MGGYFGSGSSSTYFGSSSGTGSLAPPTISPNQRASYLYALSKSKMATHSILGDIESTPGKVTSALGAALNFLARPAEGVDTALTRGAQTGWDPGKMFHGLTAGLEGHSHDTFSDFIRAEWPHFARQHKTLTAISGLAGTILTDPTLPLIIGAQAIPGVDVSVDAAEAGRLASILGTADTSAGRLKQAETALSAIKALPAGEQAAQFGARKAYSELMVKAANDEMAGIAPNVADSTVRVAISEAAKESQKQAEQRVMQLKYALPFTGGKAVPLSPVAIKGFRVAPRTPSLKGVAEAGIPGVSKAADKVGEAFKHGWGMEDFAKPALVATTKAKQYVMDTTMRHAHITIGHYFKSMSDKDIRKALDFGETNHGIVKVGKGGRIMNHAMLNKAVQQGRLTQDQGGFLRAWHDVMENLRTQEAQFGVKHEGDIGDIVYVPHRYLREGGRAYIKDIRTNFGLAKERQNLTLKNLESAIAGGRGANKGLDLVTNPAEILARRVQESADASSQHALHTVMTHVFGVPDTVPDLVRRQKAITEVRRLMKKQRGLTHIFNQKGTRVSLGRQFGLKGKAAADRIHAKYKPTLDRIDQQILDHVKGMQEKGVKTPNFSEARTASPKGFKERISHFRNQDRIAAIKLHGEMKELTRLENKMRKLGTPRGGAQQGFKDVAKEVEQLKARISKRHGLSTEQVESLGVDRAKEKVGYTEQPLTGQPRPEYPHSGEFTGASMKPSARGESWRGNIKVQLEATRTDLQHEYDALTKKYRGGKNIDHAKAIKTLQGRRDKYLNRAAEEINAAHETIRQQKELAKEEWQKEFDKQTKKYTRWQAQIEAHQRAYGAMTKNKDIPEGYLHLDTPKLHGQTWHFPPEIHAGIKRIEAADNNKNIIRSITNAWGKMMRTWKIGVTSINPGYRVRNTASDIWNMYIAGVPMPRVVQYGQRAARLQVLAHKAAEKLAHGSKDLTDEEIASLRAFAEMQLHGILSGLFQGDVEEVAHLFHSGKRARDYINGINPVGLGKAYVNAMGAMNRHVENWGRITHYLYRRQYQHMSAQASADWVKRAHFDYEELTPFETKVMKNIFPFYTWTRKDIPYQLAQMVQRPGKYAVFAHTVQTSNELATGSPHTPDTQQGIMPSWMKNNYMFRVPGFGDNAYINPNIGVQDLSSLEHPITQGIDQHLNPVAQIAGAFLTGKNLGTGQDIVGSHPRNPVSGLGADILSMIPGTDVGPTERTVRGQTVSGVGANPWATFLAGQLPLGNFLVNQTSGIKEKARGGGVLAPLGYFGGVGVYNRDLNAEQTTAQLDFQDQMKKVIRGMRDTGTLAPSKKKKNSPFQTALNAVINKGG